MISLSQWIIKQGGSRNKKNKGERQGGEGGRNHLYIQSLMCMSLIFLRERKDKERLLFPNNQQQEEIESVNTSVKPKLCMIH